MLPYRYNKRRIGMNNYWTYEDYIEWDREYRDMEYMLEDLTMDDIREYITKKYGVDDD
jgi:hypothetical protein